MRSSLKKPDAFLRYSELWAFSAGGEQRSGSHARAERVWRSSLSARTLTHEKLGKGMDCMIYKMCNAERREWYVVYLMNCIVVLYDFEEEGGFEGCG